MVAKYFNTSRFVSLAIFVSFAFMPNCFLQTFGLSTCFINVPAQVHLNAICEVLSWHYEARQLMFSFIYFTASKAIPPHMMSSLYKLSAISSVSSDFLFIDLPHVSGALSMLFQERMASLRDQKWLV